MGYTENWRFITIVVVNSLMKTFSVHYLRKFLRLLCDLSLSSTFAENTTALLYKSPILICFLYYTTLSITICYDGKQMSTTYLGRIGKILWYWSLSFFMVTRWLLSMYLMQTVKELSSSRLFHEIFTKQYRKQEEGRGSSMSKTRNITERWCRGDQGKTCISDRVHLYRKDPHWRGPNS